MFKQFKLDFFWGATSLPEKMHALIVVNLKCLLIPISNPLTYYLFIDITRLVVNIYVFLSDLLNT